MSTGETDPLSFVSGGRPCGVHTVRVAGIALRLPVDPDPWRTVLDGGTSMIIPVGGGWNRDPWDGPSTQVSHLHGPDRTETTNPGTAPEFRLMGFTYRPPVREPLLWEGDQA